MQKIRLYDSEIEIPRLCLGTWAWGNDSWWGHQNDADSAAVLEYCLANGFNFIDTAPVYGRGHSEELIGQFLSGTGSREQVIISTKFGLKWQGRYINHDLSIKRMLEEFDDSRRRLGTDYFDLYQAHWPDRDRPFEPVAEQMQKWLSNGRIKAAGLSNFTLDDMKLFMKYCPLYFVQLPFNIFQRGIEADIVPFCEEHNIVILAYSPLCSGVLTGKFFEKDAKIPKDIVRKYNDQLKPENVENTRRIIEKAGQIARDLNLSLTELAVAWIQNRSQMFIPIIGTRNIQQAKENVKMLHAVELPDEIMKKINEIILQGCIACVHANMMEYEK